MPTARLAGLLIGCAFALACTSCGPRMRVQPSIQPFEQRMPAPPEGTVPTTGRMETYTLQQSKLGSNPVEDNPQTLHNGKLYYGYYCLACHGAKGDGNGPVGESYVPKPADLSSPTVAAMSDGQLYLAMLKGTGHEPVMEQTVPRDQRWPLVLYVRKLAKSGR